MGIIAFLLDLHDVEKCPNGEVVVDLLVPIINNEQQIPINLLFSKTPTVNSILTFLQIYNSEGPHLSYNSALA
eukprot:Pgem_evm1s19480